MNPGWGEATVAAASGGAIEQTVATRSKSAEKPRRSRCCEATAKAPSAKPVAAMPASKAREARRRQQAARRLHRGDRGPRRVRHPCRPDDAGGRRQPPPRVARLRARRGPRGGDLAPWSAGEGDRKNRAKREPPGRGPRRDRGARGPRHRAPRPPRSRPRPRRSLPGDARLALEGPAPARRPLPHRATAGTGAG